MHNVSKGEMLLYMLLDDDISNIHACFFLTNKNLLHATDDQKGMEQDLSQVSTTD